jgi:hypothetical protein
MTMSAIMREPNILKYSLSLLKNPQPKKPYAAYCNRVMT